MRTNVKLEDGTMMDVEVFTIGWMCTYSGTDNYVLIKRLDGPMSIKQADEYVSTLYTSTGDMFCDTSSIVHQQHSDDTVIVTMHQRYAN